MNSKPPARLPNIGEHVRTYGTLVAIEDVTPKEIILDYIFEEIEARLEGRINGYVVKVYSTFNDFYGIETCISGAIKEAERQQERIGESNLEFVVVKITRQVRWRPHRCEKENFYDHEFRAMSRNDHGCRRDLPDDVAVEVWSSLRGYIK